MYRLIILTIISLIMFQSKLTGQSHESKIYVWMEAYYVNDPLNGSGQLVLNNHRIAPIKYGDVIEYSLSSEGKILVELVGTPSPNSSLVIDVESGKNYYLFLDFATKKVELKIGTEDNYKAYLIKYDRYKKSHYNRTISLAEDIRNPIATLTKDKLEAGPKNGTGFLLSAEGYIVTNYHVINNATSINVKGVNGDYYTLHSADVLLSDKNNDLAIIKLKNPNITFNQPPFAVKTDVADTGEDIYLLGYPLTGSMGEEVKLTTGVISSKTGYQGDIGSYQVSAAAQPGNSGGPLFDKQGNLIGIINAKINEAENVTYAIKLAYLKTLLELSGQTVTLPSVNALEGLSLSDQVKKLNNYVYIIEVNR